jgi:hypothetical protein
MASWFHTWANIKTDNIALIKMAAVDTAPLNLLVLPGKKTLIKKASNGSSTAASAK